MAAAESERAFAGQQHMRRMLHDGPRRQYRVFWATDAGDRAGAAFAPFHDRGIHLDRAAAGEAGAASGIEQRVVFEHQNGGAHRVERAAAGREDVMPRGQRCLQPGAVARAACLVHQTAAQGAGAAMYGERKAGAGIAGRAGHYASADFDLLHRAPWTPGQHR